MKKKYQKLFSTIIIWMTIYIQNGFAKQIEQCILNMPVYTKPFIKDNPNDLLIYIVANDVISKYPYFIEYKGNVSIQQGNQTLIADKVKLIQTDITNQYPIRTVIATGNVYYKNPQIILRGAKAWLNLNNKNIDVENGNYSMINRQGWGYANKIKLREKNRYIILEKGIFTTCPPNDLTWTILGSKLLLDRKKEVAKIQNARFHIGNIPIFYNSYLQLPIGNKRHSGFLLPNASYSSSSGLNIISPFYWNIAPNFDVTITPQFISFRGLKLNSEFRYLTAAGSGTFAATWLKDDHNYIKNKTNSSHQKTNNNYLHSNNNRWLLCWKHSGILKEVWNFNIDYTKVSDLKYFTDFTSKYGNSTNWYATQKFSISYTQPNWNATLIHKQFQILADYLPNKTHKTKSQLNFNYYKNNFGLFDVKANAQLARITSITTDNPSIPSTNIRLHIEPELNLPLSNNWLNINNTAKIMMTYYNQNISSKLVNSNLKKQVIRIIPSLTSDTRLVFEKYLLSNDNYVQTLEPRFQYLYIPYRNQNNINNYDSLPIQNDYNSLFRNYIYNGLDYITSSNQLTTGITTRIYDKELTERFNFSIGQIYYFKKPGAPKTQYFNRSIKNNNNTGSVLWAGDTYLQLTNNWKLHGKLQYNRLLGDITMGNFITEYHLDSEHFMQLNYRFTNHNYIKTTVKNIPMFQKGISQIGAVMCWPLGTHWNILGSYNYNLKENQPISKLLSIQYNTCCWSISMDYERKIVGHQQQNLNKNYDNRWLINVELKGLNNNPHFRNQNKLTKNILPYQKLF